MAETRTWAELSHLIEDARLRIAHARTLELRLHWARRMLVLRKEREAMAIVAAKPLGAES